MILLTGTSGQLAKEFQRILPERGLEFSAPLEEKLDISNFEQVKCAIEEIKPDVIINCAAYNLVDEAEEEPSLAFKVNSDAVGNLAVLCRRFNIFLVHFSTDYVFDGRKKEFYIEEDLVNPVNKYGESKLKGEELIKKHLNNFLILRLSWVIGEGRRNFLYKLFNWTKQKRILKISCDEVSVPTYVEDVVHTTLLSLKKGLKGLYHLTNSGYCSRYELAKYFVKKMGLDNILLPVPASSFILTGTGKAMAKRPLFSAMSNGKISKELNISIPEWEDGVDRFIIRIYK